MTPFKAGVLAVTTLVLFAYFGFSKTNPFANPYELTAMFRDVQNLKTRYQWASSRERGGNGMNSWDQYSKRLRFWDRARRETT